jgi:hypothetical protein
MATVPVPISPLPAAPSTTSPATFDANADAFIASLPAFQSQANALATNAYDNANDAYTQASNAAAQVALATAQVALAAGQASAADSSKVQAQSAAAAASVAAGAAIPVGYGQLFKTEGAANVKTTAFTTATGRVYECDTSAGAFTGTLHASPNVGDLVRFRDFSGTWGINNFTVARNGQLIGSYADDFVCDVSNLPIDMVFVGGSKGWSPQ